MKRFERSNGLDAALYKNYLYLYVRMSKCSSAVQCQTRNQVSPGSNHALLPFRRLGIFVFSIDVPVDSAV